MKPIRLIELFAGLGSQTSALDRLGIPHKKRICEFDKYAVASYNAIHGTHFETSDVTKIHAADLKIKDTDKYTYILTYSFPCFTKNTLVLTKEGYKSINNLSTSDEVLTHNNRYKNVLSTKMTGVKEIWSVKGMGIDEICCTENHKFYVRKLKRYYPTFANGKRGNCRKFLEPEWIECNKLDKSYYLGCCYKSKLYYSKRTFWHKRKLFN